MKCTQCAAVSFSAAARTLVEQGNRCPQCGGELALALDRAPVAVAQGGPPDADDGPGRRFERD